MSLQDDPSASERAESWHPGDRLRFCGTGPFWFADMVAEAERVLRVDEVYTLKTIQIYSSWTGITLEETGTTPYNNVWFELLPPTPGT